MPSPLFSIWLTLLSTFFTASLPLFFHDWENETFCVKCGLNADHFISLVRMRTKSAIADFYGSSVCCSLFDGVPLCNLFVALVHMLQFIRYGALVAEHILVTWVRLLQCMSCSESIADHCLRIIGCSWYVAVVYSLQLITHCSLIVAVHLFQCIGCGAFVAVQCAILSKLLISWFHQFVFLSLFNSCCSDPHETFWATAAYLGTRPQADRQSHNPPTARKLRIFCQNADYSSKFEPRFEIMWGETWKSWCSSEITTLCWGSNSLANQ